MNTQVVRNWMTHNPITITTQTMLPDVRQLTDAFDRALYLMPQYLDRKLVDLLAARPGHRELET